MTSLPPVRDLPPGRHAAVRAHLVQTVLADGGADVRRSRLRPLLAAAAVLAVTGSVAGVVALRDAPAPTVVPGRPAGTASPANVPGPTTPAPRVPTLSAPTPRERIPGVSDAESRRIARGCGATWSGTQPDVPPEIAARRTPNPAPGAGPDLRLFNVVRDDAGTLALLYGAQDEVTCEVDGAIAPFNPGGSEADPTSITGVLHVDEIATTSGDDASGKHGRRYGYVAAAGRVAKTVARVRITVGSRAAEARVVNGTFLVRIVYGDDYRVPEDGVNVRVVGYDAAGRVVATVLDAGRAPCMLVGPDPAPETRPECLVTPTPWP